jgi:hypothetical protein
MSKSINRIAKNLHIFARAEIIQAVHKYYPKDSETPRVKMILATQRWSDLPKHAKKYFREKAIFILTK